MRNFVNISESYVLASSQLNTFGDDIIGRLRLNFVAAHKKKFIGSTNIVGRNKSD